MLDLALEYEVAAPRWDEIPSRAALPCAAQEFFQPSGAAGLRGHSRRQFHRFFLREAAVLAVGGLFHAVYTKDASRKGLGLLSPVQLFPRDRATLWLADIEPLALSIFRCRRLGPACYDCGAIFSDGALSPAGYKELLERQRRVSTS